MPIWSAEIKELEKLYESLKGQLPDLEKELVRLVKADDENMILLYSRRCLEVIITDLCECELKRDRGSEPLKGIIDKLNKEKKIPPHIIASMHGLIELSTYGAHPKDFDPEQVKPVLSNLSIIIKWYFKCKETGRNIKLKPAEEIRQEIKITEEVKKSITISMKRLPELLSGLVALVAVVLAVLYFSDFIGDRKPAKEIEKSIAVLPLRNISEDKSLDYLGDGLTNDFLTNLENIESFIIRPRTSSEQFRNTKKSAIIIGNELNVNYLLEGDYEYHEDSIKLWIKWINTKADKQEWSKVYNVPKNQFYYLRSKIAYEAAKGLKTELTPEEKANIEKLHTENDSAIMYYWQGNFYERKGYSSQDKKTAIECYNNAIRLDPNFALAHARLAICLLDQYWYYHDRSKDILSTCEKEIKKAFLIDPNLAEADLAQGIYYYWGQMDYPSALEQFEKVLARRPENSEVRAEAFYYSACVYRRIGNWGLAKGRFRSAAEIEPKSFAFAFDAALTFDLLQEYTIALEYYKKSIDLRPDFVSPYFYLSRMFLKWEGNTEKASEILNKGTNNNKSFNSDSLIIETKILINIFKGNYEQALNYLSLQEYDVFQTQFYFRPKYLYYANLYGLMKNSNLERTYYDSARIFLENKIKKYPDDPRLHSSLGIACAGLGRDNKAVSEGNRAVTLMPMKNDAWKGVVLQEDLIMIHLMVGNYPTAIEKLSTLLTYTGRTLSLKILKCDPRWAPLDSLPEFKKLIEKDTVY